LAMQAPLATRRQQPVGRQQQQHLVPTCPLAARARVGEEMPRRDGRSARRSGRTLQFATRVSPEFDSRLRSIAERDRKLLVEVLEDALEAYEDSRQKHSAR
jgi:hypothetical protein